MGRRIGAAELADLSNRLCGKPLFLLAGLLEGEGSFMFSEGNSDLSVQYVGQDRDVADFVSKMFEQPVTSYTRSASKSNLATPKDGFKPMYRVKVNGKKAEVVMKAMYPLVFLRRKGQILTALLRRGRAIRRASTT